MFVFWVLWTWQSRSGTANNQSATFFFLRCSKIKDFPLDDKYTWMCSCELMHQLDIRLHFGESDCLTLECNMPLIDFYVTRRLLQVLKGLPDPPGAFISNTSDIFWASRGSWFPTVWAVPSAKICRWSHLPRHRLLNGASQIAECGGSQLFSCAHAPEIKLDRLQEPVSSAWLFHAWSQAIWKWGLSFASQPQAQQ